MKINTYLILTLGYLGSLLHPKAEANNNSIASLIDLSCSLSFIEPITPNFLAGYFDETGQFKPGKQPIKTLNRSQLESLSNFEHRYPVIFNFLPKKWIEHIIKALNDKKITPEILNDMNSPEKILDLRSKEILLNILKDQEIFQIKKLGAQNKNKFMTIFNQSIGKGYVWIIETTDVAKPLNEYSLENWLEMGKPKNDQAEQFLWNYKIHLMPKNTDFYKIIYRLMQELVTNEEFVKVVPRFKFINKFISEEQLKATDESKRFPIIVIYCSSGKENAQKALNIIINMFKNIEGLNLTPRFNEKVNSLIYFAQGDGDSKIKKNLSEYYEQPNKIYYKKDIMGKDRDFHLNIQFKLISDNGLYIN